MFDFRFLIQNLSFQNAINVTYCRQISLQVRNIADVCSKVASMALELMLQKRDPVIFCLKTQAVETTTPVK